MMETKPVEEKIKPFRLVKYFAFTGLVFILLMTLILTMLNMHWVRQMQRQKSEEFAHVLIENLNHQVVVQFIIPVGLRFGKIQLRNRDVFDRMDNVVRNTLHSFKVEALHIYSMDNTISYSLDKDMVGRQNFGGSGYQKAREGETTSRLVQRGNLLQIMFGFPKEVRLITIAPLRWEQPLARITDEVLGVVEVVQDLTDDYKAIFRIQILVMLTSTISMGALFLVLVFVVKRGENIIENRALERLRLKERLARAERLSSMGEMAAGISHEIRNPLGIIRSSAELLKKKMAQVDPTNSITDIIIEESTRLNGIITDFINFARPRNPNLTPCRLEDIIEKNISFLGSQIEANRITVHKRYQNSLPEIMADSDMLYQSFLNIFINAMQAMPQGGNIDVDIQATDSIVSVRFEDDGYGIPETVMEKIWDPFFTTKEKGTGLGLGIVKNIIESHGGSIQLVNRETRGARVTIELPLHQRQA